MAGIENRKPDGSFEGAWFPILYWGLVVVSFVAIGLTVRGFYREMNAENVKLEIGK